MSATPFDTTKLEMGSNVTLIFQLPEGPMAVPAWIQTNEPVTLRAVHEAMHHVTADSAVLILAIYDGTLRKAEARVSGINISSGQYFVDLTYPVWEDLNRRIYTRHPGKFPVNLRAVDETGGTTTVSLFQGHTDDISFGGAWVNVLPPIPIGSLVEFQTNFGPGKIFRSLAIVAHASITRGGVGLEFLELKGDSRPLLEQHFQEAA